MDKIFAERLKGLNCRHSEGECVHADLKLKQDRLRERLHRQAVL